MRGLVGIVLAATLMMFYVFADDTLFMAAFLNTLAMLGLWTAYATRIVDGPAPYLHPYRPPTETTSNPDEADVELAAI